MTGMARYQDPYKYERQQMPSGIFQEPATYWLGELAAGKTPHQFTQIPFREKKLIVAVHSRRDEQDFARAVMLSFVEDDANLYTATLTAHIEPHGRRSIKGCVPNQCQRFEIFEAVGRLSQLDHRGDEIHSDLPMDVYNATGSYARAGAAELLRETATGASGVDVVGNSDAFQTFQLIARRHALHVGLQAAVAAACEVG